MTGSWKNASGVLEQQQQQPFYGRLSETTRVGRYQKKHSPAHTHPGQRTSFITFLHFSGVLEKPWKFFVAKGKATLYSVGWLTSDFSYTPRRAGRDIQDIPNCCFPAVGSGPTQYGSSGPMSTRILTGSAVSAQLTVVTNRQTALQL